MNRLPLPPSAFLILAAGLLWSGVGCVKIDATVNLERDGSGTLRAIYGMPSHMIRQAESTRQLVRSLDLAAGVTNPVLRDLDIPYLQDETLLKAKFAAMARDGLQLESLKTREQGGWEYVDLVVKFNSLQSLFKQSFLSEFGVGLKHLDERSCKLTVTLPQGGISRETTSVVLLESLNKVTSFFNGFRVVVRVVLPGEIRNSNSLVSDVRRATWEWDFDKDAQVLARLAQDKIIVVFDAADVRIKDFEKPAEPFVPTEK